jgi:surface protein
MNASKVTDMRRMFFNAASFNQNLSKWDTSKVTDMKEMFCNATSFNFSLVIGLFIIILFTYLLL